MRKPSSGWLRNLDPKRSLAVRLALVVGASSLFLSLVAGTLVGVIQRAEVTRQIGTLHQQLAEQLGEALDSDIASRIQDIRVLAVLLSSYVDADSSDVQQAILEGVYGEYTGYSWLALADPGGTVTLATGDILAASLASKSQLFQAGSGTPYVGLSPCPRVDARTETGNNQKAMCGLIDFSSALTKKDTRLGATLGARLGISWAESIERQILSPLRETRRVEAFVVDSEGAVLVSDSDAISGRLQLNHITDSSNALGYEVVRWPDGRDYLTGFSVSDGFGTYKGLGWRVIVRELAADALAPATVLAQRTAAITVGVGLLTAFLCAALINRFVRPLTAIAAAADRIRVSHDSTIPVVAGEDEIARVSNSLNSLVGALDDRNRALLLANNSLEARVRDRTVEIERLSDENQQVAVSRERLRMARDLHDTLAHTLAAVLTQVRLMHKLATKQNVTQLADELQRAEEATRLGLQEARAAITQLRSNPVREFGLESALRQLAKNFGNRTGIRMVLESRGTLPDLQNARAETMFRIAEEVFHNIERHAHAKSVLIELSETSNAALKHVSLHIVDDGVGFDPIHVQDAGAHHFGMRGMIEQAALIDMAFQLTSTPGRGTEATLSGYW